MIEPKFLGDVHLGKKFETGVPLHRRGDRELMQYRQFRNSLIEASGLHIQVGDLFDKMVVPYSVVWAAAEAYKAARSPDTTFVVLRGNHDASRDADKVSAFQIFTGLVRPLGIVVVDEAPVRIGDIVLIPWHPFITAAEMVEQHADLIRDCDIAVGHWDVVMGEDNRIPAAALKALGVGRAVTGHDHVARDLVINGLDVQITGSMQPYAHGEGDMYVTLTLDELEKTDVTDKCVRLVLQPGEEAPVIDCLQLQVQRASVDGVDIGEVDFEAFDLPALFAQAVAEVGLAADLAVVALQKLEEERGLAA